MKGTKKMDERLKCLAERLVNYSMKVSRGDKVYVHYTGIDTRPLAIAVIDEVYKAGGVPFVEFTDKQVQRKLLMGLSKEQIELMAEHDAKLMDMMDCYVGIRGPENVNELADVPSDKMELYESIYSAKVHHEIRVKKTRWVVLRYPNESMAQLSGMSLEAFEDFYYKVCCLDYSKMKDAMNKLVERMNRTDKVRILAPGTDLSFSIKDIPAIPCAGELNIPDGEVYTAPVRDSVNGTITYNTPSVNQGFTFENISLTFKDGRIIDAKANDTERINKIFDIDEGARYVGEFAIGVNPYVTEPMKDILFDEKIKGSLHFTPGNCYDDAYNGNQSAIHWDLVLIQRAEWGGGEIWFDDELIRKDGIFVTEDLKCLNPEKLI